MSNCLIEKVTKLKDSTSDVTKKFWKSSEKFIDQRSKGVSSGN